MTIFNDNIIPYEGNTTFKFGMKLDEVRSFLKENKIAFNYSVDSNKDCTPPIPWETIVIDDIITLVFVEGILFEMSFEGRYEGKLPNGIGIGTKMSDAEEIDSSIYYDEDWDEYFVSKLGYWIIDDIDEGTVDVLTVFVKEAELDDEEFFKYEWIKNYK